MLRFLAIIMALAVLPLAPAAAVVAIEAGGAPVETAAAAAPTAEAASNPFGLSNGELLAGLVGLSVISMTLMLGRQQHSVSS